MKKGWKPIFTLVLIVWVLFAAVTFIELGGKYIGSNYFESEELDQSISYFLQELGPTVLNPIDAEDMKNALMVSQEEIEAHRNRYGSLTDQVENIRAQYVARIQEAEALKATELVKKLQAERDAKIADITKNFESDDHVKKKVLAEKQELVDRYIRELQINKQQLLQQYRFISYELKDMQTGESFNRGNIKGASVYEKNYSSREPLITYTLSEEKMNTWYELGDSVSVSLMEDYDLKNTLNKEHQYTGVVKVSKDAFEKSDYIEKYNHFVRSQMIFYVIWLSGVGAMIVLLFTSFKPKLSDYLQPNKVKDRLQHWEVDIQVALFIVTAVLLVQLLMMAYEPIEYTNDYYSVRFVGKFMISLALMFAVGCSVLLQGAWLYERVQTWEKCRVAVQDSYLVQLGESIQDVFLQRSIGVQSVALIGAAFIGGVGLVGSATGSGIFVLLTVGCFFVGVPALVLFLSRIGYMNRIMKDTEAMADGRLLTDIKVKGKSPFAKHAEHLNRLREGVAHSMNEQAKSERLKTELITNVSHDLRTPLTSIITYTDLLKNPDITEEERKQYIDVLDKKSARLKTLIEDLFEVSKMASGNIELHKTRVDLAQLVKQAVGEYEEDLTKAQLDLRMTIPEMPLHAYVDGQKWWRVVDNLIVNVLKYSLEGTRVYVSLKRTANGEAEFVVKNVAKYEMTENVEELFERFKRADTSRHTEGSGLGLAIAQSIVDLHGGRMTIDVDGDLFKVTVIVAAV